MPLRTRLLLIGSATVAVVLLVVLIAIGLRRSPAAPTAAPDPTATAQRPATGTPAPSWVPGTVSDDLVRPLPPVDPLQGGGTTTPARTAPRLSYTYALADGVELPAQTVSSVAVDQYAEVSSAWVARLATTYGFRAGVQPFIGTDSYSLSGPLTSGGTARLEVEQLSGFTTFAARYDEAAATPPSAAGAIRAAREFLQRSQQLAPSLRPPVTYERRSVRGVRFVEFQRAWDPLPILEVGGTLQMSVDPTDDLRPPNADVVSTSDGRDGLARLDDFNTTTVGVDGEGRVVSVVARTRQVISTLPARPIKTAQQAWADLRAGRGILGLTLPSLGTDARDWDALFPNGEARSDAARVTEVLLAYAEKGAGEPQTYLQPVYVFRGSATLASGGSADFVVAVPALVDDRLPSVPAS